MKRKTRLLLSCFLVLLSAAACGRRGDPVAIVPYQEIPSVADLSASREGNDISLTWSMPEEGSFPLKALKGFIIFRAEVPEGADAENCDCDYRMLDFLTPVSGKKQPLAPEAKERISPDTGQVLGYTDIKTREGISYIYKVVITDTGGKWGKDSNTVIVRALPPEAEKGTPPAPEAPGGLRALYTQKSVIITWDEVSGTETPFYRIYRAEGAEFHLVGEAVVPAFTDKDIEPSKTYYYKVSAVIGTEGPPSREMEVTTEAR